MILGLTAIYLMAFQCCAWPAILRVQARRSSADLSVWREWLLLVGTACQFVVMRSAGAPWVIWISPILSSVSIGVLLTQIYRYRS